ncbi:MAG: hypothetical protein DSZ30_01590 [Aquificaceae bacterium]|nr:MAG: hypothetical protein DSZ30_01590 [Aquificaceae bacterium]
MKFSKHAKDKLNLYGTTEEVLQEALRKPLYICRDYEKFSTVYIVELKGKIFSVVVKDNTIITIYRTDLNRLNSRIKSGRWNCWSCN